MKNTLSNYELAKKRAQEVAREDLEKGLFCDPTRHNALENSAFATWYNEYYLEKGSDYKYYVNYFDVSAGYERKRYFTSWEEAKDFCLSTMDKFDPDYIKTL